MTISISRNSNWSEAALRIAGIYHIFWGISVIFFPNFWFDIANLSHPNYTQMWQFIGLSEMVFGIGYVIASYNPLRHWHIIFLGLMVKICVTIGFIYYYMLGKEPVIVFNMVLSNHIFWLIPFGVILYNAYYHQYLLDNEMIGLCGAESVELLSLYETNKGRNLKDVSGERPVLLIFLRHFGCTFCKETLTIVNNLRQQIESKGTKIVLVHMHDNAKALVELKKFHLADMEIVSDPESMLYKGFRLKRGTFSQLLGFKVWRRSIYLWIKNRVYIVNNSDADIFQMPGVFLIYREKVVKQYIHKTPADVPPYLELATY